jgi:phosphoribosylglycinamide formyltransferase 1
VSNPRIVVLASGAGSLFRSLIDARADLGIDIVGLIADGQVPAVDIAREFDIPAFVIPVGSDRAKWNTELASQLRSLSPDLIVSAGFMRVLGPTVVDEFEGRIINTHPALLPLFPGAHGVRDALAAGAKVTGTTVHFVDAGVDTGRIIAQAEVPVLDDDTEATLHERIKVQERALLVEVVGQIVQGKVQYDNPKNGDSNE